MARTEDEIFNSIVAKKNATTELATLNSPSTTAIWRKWAYITASAIYALERLYDTFTAEIVEINRTNKVGRADWYVQEAKNFQFGYDLQYIDNVYKYAVIDEVAKIIKRASQSTETIIYGGSIPIRVTTIKVATTDAGGNIVALSAPQKAAFDVYIDRNMFAGSYIKTLSANTDFIKIIAKIYYNPLFVADTVKANVATALSNYLANLDFNGEVLRTDLIIEARKVVGVEDFEITTLEVRTNAGSFAAMGISYIPVAGYIAADALFPIANNLTMIPK